MSRFCQAVFATIALAMIGLLPSVGFSQPTKESPESTLFLLVRTPPSETADKLHFKFETGLKQTVKEMVCDYTKLERPEMIPPATFESISRLLGGGFSQAPVALNGEISWRQIPARDTVWELKLPKAKQVLKELTVEYKKAGTVKYTTASNKPDEKRDETKEFGLILPGSYSIPMLADDEPESYSGTVRELDPETNMVKETEIKKTKFPEIDRFFSITIRGFRGNQQRLFDVMQDSRFVPNPVKNLEPVKNYTFAFANLSSDLPIGGRILEGQEYLARVPSVTGRNAKRVWIMFPLTKEEADAKAKELNKLSGADLSKLIRTTGDTVTAKDNELVNADSKPRFFELPDMSNGNQTLFGRNIKLEDFRGLAKKYPAVHRLVLWEFDNGDTQSSIEVADNNGKSVNVLNEEIVALPNILQEKSKAPPEKEGSKEPKKEAIPEPKKTDSKTVDPKKNDPQN